MRSNCFRRLAACRPAAIALLAAALADPALASEDDRQAAVAPLPLYTQECAACHLAYPAGLLPAASWQRLMAGLPRHFGTDASLEPASRNAIDAWLQAHAGTHRKLRRETAPPAEDRITRADWFVREHRKVAAADWQRPAIKSAANCDACHVNAKLGSFNERDIRIPR